MFSTTGLGLTVVISSPYQFYADWMSFASWYSLNKNLPDADVLIELTDKVSNAILFSWPSRCKVPVKKGRAEYPQQTMIISPYIMAVRELSKETDVLELSPVHEDRMSSFVSYEQGCGAFVTADWINRVDCPFPWAEKFMTSTSTTNEVRVLKLWKQLSPLYTTVSSL